MAYFDFHGNSVYYNVQGEGVQIIMCHGLAASSPQVEKLLDGVTGIQLISLDFPGHGKSPYPINTVKPSFNYYSDIVVHLIKLLNISNVIIGGISMGAGISMNLAIRYPDLVKAIIAIRPAWLTSGNPDNLQIILKGADYLEIENGLKRFKEIQAYAALEKNLPNAALSVLGIFADDQQKELPLVLRNMIMDSPLRNILDVEKINCPVCIIANEDDPLHPKEMAEEIHRMIEKSVIQLTVSRYVDDNNNKIETQRIISRFLASII